MCRSTSDSCTFTSHEGFIWLSYYRTIWLCVRENLFPFLCDIFLSLFFFCLFICNIYSVAVCSLNSFILFFCFSVAPIIRCPILLDIKIARYSNRLEPFLSLSAENIFDFYAIIFPAVTINHVLA